VGGKRWVTRATGWNRKSGVEPLHANIMPVEFALLTLSLWNECHKSTSKTYLGAQFRRLRSRLDTPVAIKAMAAKLARLVYRMLRYGMKYVDRGAAFYEAQHRQLQIKHLKSKAAKLGFQIIQVPAA
jgi:hypothetical protein